jgi:hypothetical protein
MNGIQGFKRRCFYRPDGVIDYKRVYGDERYVPDVTKEGVNYFILTILRLSWYNYSFNPHSRHDALKHLL